MSEKQISDLQNEYELLCEAEVCLVQNVRLLLIIFFLFLKKKIDLELNGLLGNQSKLETKLITLKNFL